MYDALRVMTNFSCNQRCSFCYQDKWDENYIEFSHIYQELEKQGLKDVVLRDTFRSVTILGGEPTMHPKIKQVIDHFAIDQQIEVVRMNTNGVALLSGHIPLNTIENLDVLCVDMGLGQKASYRADMIANLEKLSTLREIADEYPELTIKLNFVHSKDNHCNQQDYMADILTRIATLQFPEDRLLLNVCQDVYADKNYINAESFTQQIFGTYLGQEKYFDSILMGNYKLAYFTFDLYSNTEDFLFVWNQGSTTSFKEYLDVVGKKNAWNDSNKTIAS